MTTTVLLVGIAPAQAWAYTWRFDFGYASCGSQYPRTQTMGEGEVKHQIGYGVAESYGERYWNNGSSTYTRTYKFDTHYGSWATISGIGYPNAKKWGCVT